MYLIIVLMMLPSVLCTPVREAQAQLIQMKVAEGVPLDEVFTDFMRVYNKTYNGDEESMRREIFKYNVKHIQDHNHLYTKGEKSYYLGVNHLSDLTHREFLNAYTSPMRSRGSTNATTFLAPSNIQIPAAVDWRASGYVTPVKSQGHCGSCWAFSSTGSLEGQHARKTGKLISLSEQQLIDCSVSTGNHGCNGGLMDNAFSYLARAGGSETEQEYPYQAMNGQCKFVASEIRATVSGLADITSGSESALQAAVASVGPISVAVDASEFQHYAGGIYDNPECSTTNLDHAVLVVGYGASSNGQDYWLVKNSWTANWGMQGYILMSRNKNNQCGIATQASYPLV